LNADNNNKKHCCGVLSENLGGGLKEDDEEFYISAAIAQDEYFRNRIANAKKLLKNAEAEDVIT
jgi:hypothetical protein